MASLISLDFECRECDFRWDALIPREERGQTQACPDCGKVAGFRTLSVPNFTRASYVDGGRKSDKDYQDMKIASKLEKEMYDKPPAERGELRKEIAKVKKVKK